MTAWKRDGSCPGCDALAAISDKWKASIVVLLAESESPVRFAALQRALVPISRKILSEVLRELEADRIVDRRAYAEVPPRVEYSLTEHGHALMPILRELHRWRVSLHAEHGLSEERALRE